MKINFFNYFIIVVIIFLLGFFVGSCNKQNKNDIEAVRLLIGKTLYIQDSLSSKIIDKEFLYDFNDSDYKIVTYIDSTGCTSCNMKLASWSYVIDEFKSLTDIEVSYLMIINSKDTNDISNILKTGDFNLPVIIDTKSEFIKQNEIPEESAYRTFLLDDANKIVALGNPVMNPKIKELFKKIISDDSMEEKVKDNSLAEKSIRNLGLVNKGDTVDTSFSIFNRDSVTYHIQGIIPSCDCITVESESFVLYPGNKNNIKICFISDTSGTTFKKHVDIFYKEKDNPDRLTVYGYLK